MDIFLYVEKIKGRALGPIEKQAVRAVYLDRCRELNIDPGYVAQGRVVYGTLYEEFAPIVDKYFEEQADA